MNRSSITSLFAHLEPEPPDSNERSDASRQLCYELLDIGYPMQVLQNFLLTTDSWETASMLLSALYDLSRAEIGWKDMAENIDDSCYSPADWARAMIYFLKREGEASGEKIDPASMVAYLCCSAEVAAKDPILMPFEELIKEMLDTYGYERNP